MAINHLPLVGRPAPAYALWLRLPLQFVLIAWAYAYTGKVGSAKPAKNVS